MRDGNDEGMTMTRGEMTGTSTMGRGTIMTGNRKDNNETTGRKMMGQQGQQ